MSKYKTTRELVEKLARAHMYTEYHGYLATVENYSVCQVRGVNIDSQIADNMKLTDLQWYRLLSEAESILNACFSYNDKDKAWSKLIKPVLKHRFMVFDYDFDKEEIDNETFVDTDGLIMHTSDKADRPTMFVDLWVDVCWNLEPEVNFFELNNMRAQRQ